MDSRAQDEREVELVVREPKWKRNESGAGSQRVVCASGPTVQWSGNEYVASSGPVGEDLGEGTYATPHRAECQPRGNPVRSTQ